MGGGSYGLPGRFATAAATSLRSTIEAAVCFVAATSGMGVVAAQTSLAPVAASRVAASDAPASTGIEAPAANRNVELAPVQPAAPLSASAPLEAAPAVLEETVLGRGSASFYASKFHGRRTASGERFDARIARFSLREPRAIH